MIEIIYNFNNKVLIKKGKEQIDKNKYNKQT